MSEKLNNVKDPVKATQNINPEKSCPAKAIGKPKTKNSTHSRCRTFENGVKTL
jgi:hypothetical protein